MSAIATVAAAPILAAIAIEDLRHHRIRNRYVVALAVVAITAVFMATLDGDTAVIGRAAAGALLATAPIAATWLAQPGRIGGGDVKLAAALGALVGAVDARLGLAVVGIGLVGALVAALLLRRPRIALAPAMTTVAGAFLVGASWA